MPEVHRLSNLHQSRDGIPAETAPSTELPTALFRRVDRREVDSALRLILGNDGHLASDEQVVEFLSYALHRSIDVNDMVVVESKGKLVWAALPVISAGRTSLLLTPGYITPQAAPHAANLIDHACRDLARAGVELAQVLLDPMATEVVDTFRDAGFSRLAELAYLHRRLGRATAKPHALPDGLAWQSYSPANHALFADTILKSYEQSLDCPALSGTRNIEDVVAGHKAAGDFDPDWWFLLTEHGQPRGIVLLARTRQSGTCELVYLGLPPDARGRGHAARLVQQALMTASQGGCKLLSLAVDTKNAPALKLYYRFGMQQVMTRLAMIRDVREMPRRDPVMQATASR